uniref:Uncharacterized protein n=1 Tax=Thermus caliditerrae TaxID=1330700 RepID=A0A7C5VF84_9DEIN
MSPIFPFFPSAGFALAAGKPPETLFLLLVLYYLIPLAWYAAGRGGALVLARFRHLPLEALVLVLPYALYWLMAGAIRAPLLKAYRVFLRGPGLGVPLTVLILWPLGYKLPPLLGSLFLFAAILLVERIWRRTSASTLTKSQ